MIDFFEVVYVCVYLCSIMLKSIMGIVYKVNGGWYI